MQARVLRCSRGIGRGRLVFLRPLDPRVVGHLGSALGSPPAVPRRRLRVRLQRRRGVAPSEQLWSHGSAQRTAMTRSELGFRNEHQYSTVLYCTVQYCTVLYCPVQLCSVCTARRSTDVDHWCSSLPGDVSDWCSSTPGKNTGRTREEHGKNTNDRPLRRTRTPMIDRHASEEHQSFFRSSETDLVFIVSST